MSDFHFSPRPNRADEIQWQDWGAAAFDRAREQDKPILLAISAVWCHWCHVMDETTYSDPDIIRTVNEHYVPIRVDNDERPDINRRYNLGGWPTTAFLTPEGELLTGGTYVPPEQMRSYLTQVRDAYRNSKEQIVAAVAEIRTKRSRSLDALGTADQPLTAAVDRILNEVKNNFDATYGGFGDEPKFPQTDALELALEKYYETDDDTLRQIIVTTLTNMAGGGLYDHMWGGFFRYSTTRDWSIPHYEKMLEDNAKLLALYVHAWQVTGEELFLKTVRSLTAYIDLSLSDQERGGFYGSQDADETFYTLPREQREKVPAPYVDRTFYTDWNALMVSAYLDAAHILPPAIAGDRVEAAHLRAFALKTLDRLWNEMYEPGIGLYHFCKPDRRPQLLGQLTDPSCVLGAFLDAYEATGDNTYVERARTVADLAIKILLDQATGAFYNEEPGRDALGLLTVPDRSVNENALMADGLLRLAALTGDEQYRTVAERALAYFSGDYERYNLMAADYARTVDHFLTEPVSVRIVGGVQDPRALALVEAALKEYVPERVVQLLDPLRDGTRLDQLGYPHGSDPLAYVCLGQHCLAPVSDAQDLGDEIRQVRGEA